MSSAFPLPASADAVAIGALFAGQHDRMLQLRTSTADERIAHITRLRDAMLAAADEFYAAAHADYRKPKAEVDIAEFLPVISEANDAIRNLRSWMRPTGVWPSLAVMGTSSEIRYEPRGRALLISPWNYPINLTFGPLVSALAAGCTVIIKPSEMTPHISAVMAKVIAATFTPDHVALVEGDASVSQALLDLPFDHIFFTGSPAIGKVVMAAAAKHLASVTLELGGKSPTIVDATADVEAAATTILWGKYTNNGQTCIAPDHIYVHASIKDRFVAACRDTLAKTYGKTAEDQKNSPDLARVVNQRHTARLQALLDDARARGAVAVVGGEVSLPDCFVAPTLLEGVPEDAKIMDEEIFGPILPIAPFTDLDDVIRRINAAPKPLALYIWSKDDTNIERVLSRTSSGGACVNHTVVQFAHARLPFGGVNNSGIGNAHGHFGFKAFSHERAIVRTRIPLANMFFPPYTERARQLVGMLLKML